MAQFDVAHIREQGVDLIIVPLKSDFGYKTDDEKDDVRAALQLGARQAGLSGTVVPVWEWCGRMAFLAPHNFHPYFRSISLRYVFSNINRRLIISEN